MTIPILPLRPDAKLPVRATPDSAGADIFAHLPAPATIAPGQTAKIPAGFALAVPKEHAAFIYARSGLGMHHGIVPANCVGVIDADYRGEVVVGLKNTSSVDFVVKPFDRIAQMVIAPVCLPDFYAAQSLDATQRGEDGFGSSGR